MFVHILRKILGIITLAFLLISCETKLSVSQSSFDAQSDGLSTSIGIEVNNDWSASSSADWCVLSPTQGDKTVKTITLTIQANPSYDDRECTVTVQSKDKSETISVRQKQQDGLILETKAIDISDREQSFEVKLSSNVAYDMSISCGWIKHVSTRALNTQTIVFQAEENTSTESRNGTISFTRNSGGLSSVISVTQKQRDFISLSTNEIDFEWGGTTQSIGVSANVDFEIVIPGTCNWLHATKKGNGQNYVLEVTADSFVPTPASTSGVSDRSTVIVLRYGDITRDIRVTQAYRDYIWVSKPSIALYVGDTETISAVAFFHEGIDKHLTWSSKNESVASVVDGVISAKSKGYTEIVVCNEDGSRSTTIPVTVKRIIDDVSIIAKGSRMTVTSNGYTLVFQSTISWPAQINSIKINFACLCYPDGRVYDIQVTSSKQVTFIPITGSGSLSDGVLNYYSTWFVSYQIEIDGETFLVSSKVDAHSWG